MLRQRGSLLGVVFGSVFASLGTVSTLPGSDCLSTRPLPELTGGEAIYLPYRALPEGEGEAIWQ